MRVAKDRVVLLLFPRRVGVLADVGIVVAGIAGNLGTQEGGAEKLLVDIGELNLGKHESFVVAMKLIHLDGVLAVVHEVACLLYAALLAEGEQFAGILQGDLLLPLEAADAIHGWSLDGEVAFVATGAHTHRMAMAATDVALQYLGLVEGEGAVAVVGDEELALDLLHYSSSEEFDMRNDLMKPSILPSITPPTSEVWCPVRWSFTRRSSKT